MTGSPFENPVAPGPSCSTQPAFSWPRVWRGRGGTVAAPSRMCRSEWQAPAPPTLIRTSPAPGSGTGTSRSSAGFCASTNWNACMVAILVSYPFEIDQQVPRPPEDIALPVRWRVDHEPRVLHAANEGFERHVHL